MKIVFGFLGLGIKEIETQTVPSAAQDEFSSTFGSSWSYGFKIWKFRVLIQKIIQNKYIKHFSKKII